LVYFNLGVCSFKPLLVVMHAQNWMHSKHYRFIPRIIQRLILRLHHNTDVRAGRLR